MYEELHTPLIPILQHVLGVITLPSTGLLLDLGCGSGEKSTLLSGVCGPAVRIVGLDIDRQALQQARLSAQSEGNPTLWSVGDAHALPLRNSCVDAAVCIAALSLFAEPRLALSELQRVLRPGASVMIVTAEQRWAEVIHWPPVLEARLCDALASLAYCPANADLTGELAELLLQTGFVVEQMRAFVYGHTSTARQAELPLLPWRVLRPLLKTQLTTAELAACDVYAAEPELELCSLVLAGVGYREL